MMVLSFVIALSPQIAHSQKGNAVGKAPILAMAGFTPPDIDVNRLNWMFDREITKIQGPVPAPKPQVSPKKVLDKPINFIGLPREHFLKIPPPPVFTRYGRLFSQFTSHPQKTDQYDPIIIKYASIYHLDPRLIKSVIAAESGFNENAVSARGARGLMQVVPRTASHFGISSYRLFFGDDNIAAGSAYLANLFANILKKLGLTGAKARHLPNWVVARVIAAYHAGPRFLRSRWLYRSTREYVRKVMLFYHSPVSQIRNDPPPQKSLTTRFIAEI